MFLEDFLAPFPRLLGVVDRAAEVFRGEGAFRLRQRRFRLCQIGAQPFRESTERRARIDDAAGAFSVVAPPAFEGLARLVDGDLVVLGDHRGARLGEGLLRLDHVRIDPARLIDHVLGGLQAVLGGLTGPGRLLDLLLQLLPQCVVAQVPAHGSGGSAASGGRHVLVLRETARLSEIRAYKRVSPWLSRMIHLVHSENDFFGSLGRRSALIVCRSHGRRSVRRRDRTAGLGRLQRARFGGVVREGPFRSLLVRDARLLRHESADSFAVRRLQAEEFREVTGRRQSQGPAGRLAVDQAEVLEPLRVLVHLRADHVEQVALQERLMVRDEGRGLEKIPIDLGRREGPCPFRVIGADLHRPLRSNLGDLDRAVPFRVLLRQGTQVFPYHFGRESGRPSEFLRREGLAGAKQGRFHERPRIHGTASWLTGSLGPRAGIESSSSVGSSVSMDSRFTKISPYGYSFCHSLTFSRWARNRRDMNTVTSSQTSPIVSCRSGIGSPLNWASRCQVRAMSSVRSSPCTFWWKFGANLRIACSRRAFSCIWMSASRRASSKASMSSMRVTARRPSRWIASVSGVAVPARTTWL